MFVSVAIGIMGAFIVPARDAMLSQVDDGEIQRTVTAMTWTAICQSNRWSGARRMRELAGGKIWFGPR